MKSHVLKLVGTIHHPDRERWHGDQRFMQERDPKELHRAKSKLHEVARGEVNPNRWI
jgi:hypothetical protein